MMNIYSTSFPTAPSDAFITVASASAFPGAATIAMPGSNHFQMRNDSNTRDVLNAVYDGEVGTPSDKIWWTIQPRQ